MEYGDICYVWDWDSLFSNCDTSVDYYVFYSIYPIC